MPKLRWRRRSCYITSLAAAVSVFIIWLIVTYMFAFDEDDFPDNSIYDIFVEEQGRRQEVFPLDEEIAEWPGRSLFNRSSLSTLIFSK